MTLIRSLLPIASILLVVTAVPASGQTLGYSISSDELIELDLETSVGTLVGAVATSGFAGLAIAQDGSIWGVSVSADGTDDLWQIDPADASSTRIGALSIQLRRTESAAGLTFDACGTLWLVFESTLYEVNTVTAEMTVRASLSEDVAGLTALGDDLIAVLRSSPPRLGRIEPESGDLTLFSGSLPLPANSSGIAFDTEGGLWAVFDFSAAAFPFFTSSILELDPATGEVLSTLEVPDPSGVFGANLAITPPLGVCDNPAEEIPIDKPAALALLGLALGLGGVVLLRRM